MKKKIERPVGRETGEGLSQPASRFSKAGTAAQFGLQADRKLDDQQAVLIPPDGFPVKKLLGVW